MVSLADLDAQMPEPIAWRGGLHVQPEVTGDVHRTAGLVAEPLTKKGVDKGAKPVGRRGAVAVIRSYRTQSRKGIGLRADRDARSVQEQTNLPCTSKSEGKMHACGHDGHTTILLDAAHHLAPHPPMPPDFDRTVDVIFQHVVTSTQIHMGTTDSVISEIARLQGTGRSPFCETRGLGTDRMTEISKAAAAMTGADVDFAISTMCP